jgi:hypothetical protein
MSRPEQPTILMILTWFGPWPGWIRPFLESCRWNASVDWLIAGDAPPPDDAPPNVRFLTLSFTEWREMAGERLGVPLAWREPYKLCDLKPAYAVIHADIAAPYDYWGFGDLDVIYGDIRRHYDAATLAHDLVTTHDDVVAGHFTILRNEERMVRAYERIPGWRGMFADPAHVSFDEQVVSRLFLPLKGRQKLRRLFTPFLGGGLFVERFSTAIPPRRWIDGTTNFPARWIWREGRLTAEGTPQRDFLYLHFSHWQSARWTRGQPAAWAGLERLDQLPPGRPGEFAISAQGFTPV